MTVYYSYHMPIWLGILGLLFLIIGLIATIKSYYYKTYSQNLFSFVALTLFLTLILDPTRFALRTTKKLPDGSEVRVKKPIIAFRRYEETSDSFPGDDGDTLPEQWRFERAYLRI